ncbi:MAG: hypothetical protein ACFB21_15580 [Opitutales bacterium]
MRAFRLGSAVVLLLSATFSHADDWPGYEAGTKSWNSSPSPIAPSDLQVAWARSFETPFFAGTGWRPNKDVNPLMRTHLHSRNLVVLDGHLALVATNNVPKREHDSSGPLVTILDAATGDTRNVIGVRLGMGNSGMRGKYPEYPRFNGAENFHGATNVWWDPETKILYLAAPGDGPSQSAYLPLANTGTWEPGSWQAGIPAYRTINEQFPEIADVFGNPRSATVQEANGQPTDSTDAWGLDLRFFKRERLKPEDGVAAWLQKVPGWNRSSFFEVDEDGPLLIFHHSAGHGQGGHPMFVNKYTGMLMHDDLLPGSEDWPELTQPFLRWGGSLIGDGRVYFFGPSGNDGGKFVSRPNPSQDLYLWAYDYRLTDEQPNSGATFGVAKDTLELAPAFHYTRQTRGEGGAESWVELDGFYRNKAALIADNALWFAWKPARNEPVELLRADESGIHTASLDIGTGLTGGDLWPHFSYAEVDGNPYLAYYGGVGVTRERTEMKDHEGERITGWETEAKPPRGPAELAIFDIQAGKVSQKWNLTEAIPHLPPNSHWGYLERSHMIVAGRFAVVGWVETTQTDARNAQLALTFFDLADPSATPQLRRYDLGFSGSEFPQSILNGLVAADGTLYAHILQADSLAVDDPEFEAQHVLALR